MGRVYKLAKVEIKDVAKGTYHVINRPVLKTFVKEISDDAMIDICCQFVSNLINNLKDSEIRTRLDFDNVVYKAFTDISIKNAVLDAGLGITHSNEVKNEQDKIDSRRADQNTKEKKNKIESQKTKLTTSLWCVREMLSKMQSEGVDWESFEKGGKNCLVEIGGAFFDQWFLKRGKGVIFLNEQQQKQIKVAFNMFDPDSLKIIENILKNILKK